MSSGPADTTQPWWSAWVPGPCGTQTPDTRSLETLASGLVGSVGPAGVQGSRASGAPGFLPEAGEQAVVSLPFLVRGRPGSQACEPKPEGFCFCQRHRSSPGTERGPCSGATLNAGPTASWAAQDGPARTPVALSWSPSLSQRSGNTQGRGSGEHSHILSSPRAADQPSSLRARLGLA